MISITMGCVTSAISMPSVVITGLQDGSAVSGDILSVSLSDRSDISGVSWGTTPGGAELGQSQTLIVPNLTETGPIFLSIESRVGPLFASFIVQETSLPQDTQLSAGPDRISVIQLAERPQLADLLISQQINAITVEFA
ncbi:MAG: hypothetical protein AAGL89_10685 [Pseudomonadota bacterium]